MRRQNECGKFVVAVCIFTYQNLVQGLPLSKEGRALKEVDGILLPISLLFKHSVEAVVLIVEISTVDLSLFAFYPD